MAPSLSCSDPVLSIVIPTHRRAEKLENLLNSLRYQSFRRGRYEILVVSNFADENSRAITQRLIHDLPGLKYFELGQKGVNASRNHGLENATSDLVYFLDDDCELQAANHLEKLVELHEEYSAATAIGGGYLLPQDSSAVEQAYHRASHVWMSPSKAHIQNTWRLVGGNVSYKKSLLSAVRFNPDIIFGGSETEMHLRLAALNHQGILHPAIHLIHRCRLSFVSLLTKGFRQGRTAGKFSSGELFKAPKKRIPLHRNSFGFREGKAVLFYHFLYRRAFFIGFKFGRLKRRFKGGNSLSICPGFLKTFSMKIYRAAFALFDYSIGALRLFYRRTPEPTHGSRGSIVFIFKFVLFCLRKIRLNGSKTSRFLFREWQKRTTSAGSPAIYIPSGKTPSEIVALANSGRAFGFQRLVFREDFIADDRCSETAQSLIRSGFEILIFYKNSVNKLDLSNRIRTLKYLGCQVIPFLNRDSCDEAVLAIGPETDLELLKKVVEKSSPEKAAPTSLIFVDFLNDRTFSAEKTYTLSNEVINNELLAGLTWETLDLFQPFGMNPLSPNRLQEGTVRHYPGQCVKQAGKTSHQWSIIIPCFENFTYLLPVLNHIFRQNYDPREFEVVLVDDGSEFKVEDFLAPHFATQPPVCSLKIVRLERRSLDGEYDSTFRAGIARNAGVLHSTGAKILFLDSDILISAGHLRTLDEALGTSDVVQNVRAMLTQEVSHSETSIVDEADLQGETYRENFYWESFKKIPDWNQLSAPWKYVCTYSLALKRSTFNQVHFFRPEFCEYGFEDTEMGFRLFRAGFRFQLLKSPVFHLYPMESSKSGEIGREANTHNSWAAHFDERSRHQTLCRTAALFYRIHRDPSIFFELRSLLDRG